MVLYSAFMKPDLFWGRIARNPTFTPGGDILFAPPVRVLGKGLRLVVTSGALDYPSLRTAALEWNDMWSEKESLPWALNFITIEDGTHAASSTDSYRKGMLWLFNRDI